MAALTDPDPPRRNAERREEIVAGAQRVFTRQGYVRTRIKDIVAETGYSETILFSHFSSKDEIFTAAIIDPLDRHVEDMLEQMERIRGAGHRARQRVLIAANEQMLVVMNEVVELLGVALFSDLEVGRRYYRDRLTPLFDRWVEATAQSLEGWGRTDLSPRLILTTLFGMQFGRSLDTVMQGGTMDVPTVARDVGRRIYDGVRA